MAKKKSRTPPPPRRPVQAPKRRETPTSADDRRKLLLLVAFAAAGLVALGAVIAVIALAGGGGGSNGSNAAVAATMRAAGCTYQDTPGIVAVANHANVPSLKMKVHFDGGKAVDAQGVHYWTYPPASGPHYGIPAVWNFYDEPVPVLQVVHNEEHGGVIIWWGSKVPSSEVDKLRAWYQKDPVSVLGTPAPRLGNKVAVTAWTGNPSHYFQNGDYGTGHVAICPRFDEKAFDAFRNAYRGKGPEGIPMSVNQPGT